VTGGQRAVEATPYPAGLGEPVGQGHWGVAGSQSVVGQDPRGRSVGVARTVGRLTSGRTWRGIGHGGRVGPAGSGLPPGAWRRVDGAYR
jgi:hypothetical protein